jgi:hypothetical protein
LEAVPTSAAIYGPLEPPPSTTAVVSDAPDEPLANYFNASSLFILFLFTSVMHFHSFLLFNRILQLAIALVVFNRKHSFVFFFWIFNVIDIVAWSTFCTFLLSGCVCI